MKGTMRDAFWNVIHAEMVEDPALFVLTADFGAPGLDRIAADYADRFLSVGISEQNLVNVAAGLAQEGCRVVAYGIAPFFLRAAEQIRINLAMASQFRPLNVTLVGVGVGFSYVVSGPSHHALEDLAVLRAFPGVGVITPSDTASAASAALLTRRAGIRYLRFDSQVLPELYPDGFRFPDTGYVLLRDDPRYRVLLIGSGAMTHTALEVAEALDAAVLDLLSLRGTPFGALPDYGVVCTLEEGVADCGGIDSWVRAQLPDTRVVSFGTRGPYEFRARSRHELRRAFGMDADSIIAAIREVVK